MPFIFLGFTVGCCLMKTLLLLAKQPGVGSRISCFHVLDASRGRRCGPEVNLWSKNPELSPGKLHLWNQVNQFQLVIFVFCFCTVDDRSLEVRCVPRNLNIDSRRVSDQSRGPMLLSIYKKVNPSGSAMTLVGWIRIQAGKKNEKK
jgi:hypothetical protein